MMGPALLIVGWMATLGFAATGVIGYRIEPHEALGLHMLLGLAASLLILFSHSWIMFYLIGTGKAIKEAVAEHDLGGDAVQQTKDFKNLSYPWMMLAMGFAMATFIVGGGVHTRVVPAWVHQALYLVTLLVQLRTLQLEHRVLRRNRRLMLELTERIRKQG